MNLRKLFSDFEMWRTLMTFSIIADFSFTMMGVAKWGARAEGNPLTYYALTESAVWWPFMMGFFVVVLMFGMAKKYWDHGPYASYFKITMWSIFLAHSVLSWGIWTYIFTVY